MVSINIICPSGSFGSLNYLASIMKHILGGNVSITHSYMDGCHNLLIDEGVTSVICKRKADVWWTDTPAILPNTYHDLRKILSENELFTKHYTVSEFCKRHYREIGIPVEETVIPRPINPILFNYYCEFSNRQFDIITIGNHCICDRKNLRMQREIFLDLNFRYCIISDIFIPRRDNLTKYEFGSVSDELKAELLSKSKFLLWTSFAEGFGMPVLEAMATGTVPIYTDIPAHNEFAVGIPVKPVDKVKRYCYGMRIIKYVIDKDDVIEAVKYALGMSRDEWENLSMECIYRATEVYNDFISKINLLVSS